MSRNATADKRIAEDGVIEMYFEPRSRRYMRSLPEAVQKAILRSAVEVAVERVERVLRLRRRPAREGARSHQGAGVLRRGVPAVASCTARCAFYQLCKVRLSENHI